MAKRLPSTVEPSNKDLAARLSRAAAGQPTAVPRPVEGRSPAAATTPSAEPATAQVSFCFSERLLKSLRIAAATQGTSQKVLVARALAAAGFDADPLDLENRQGRRS